MWRNNEVGVGKVGKRRGDNYTKENSPGLHRSYPHNEDLKSLRIWLNEGLMKNIHISTTLIVLIIFYI